MTDDRTLERAARSWIEAGPTRAPERAVEAALRTIDTTNQERGLRVPWRVPRMTTPVRVAVLVAVGALVLAGVSLFGIGGMSPLNPPPTSTPSASATPSAPASSAAGLDYSDLPGRILVEHLGNALDLSESEATDYNPDTRRLYFIDPADMTSETAVEFLPGQPTTGKSAADVSHDATKVVFQDFATPTRLYEANLDGTSFRQLPVDCTCSLLYPDYDPTATKVVYVRVEGIESWLEILDLGTNETTRLEETVGPYDNAVPEQPAWSPDGRSIAFTRITWPRPNEPIVGTVHYGDQAPTSGVLSVVDVATGVVRDLPVDGALSPGDAAWTPDSSTILYVAGPFSTTGSVSAAFPHGMHEIGTDGTGDRPVNGFVSPAFFPDGSHILTKGDGGMANGGDGFNVMLPDYSGSLPVNRNGMDLTDLAQGFSYVGHWIPEP
jgi:hypothetical protein